MLKRTSGGYTFDPKELVEGIDKYEKPSYSHPSVDKAIDYTKYLGSLSEASTIARNFEAHSGFGRNYPGSPMIDENFRLTDKELAALEKMKAAKPFRVEHEDFLNIIQELYVDLAEAHNHVPPFVRHDGEWVNPKESSFYTSHAVFLTGPKSIVTVLHEYIHSLGYGEVVAVWWSTNAFRLMYPKSFEKLKFSKINPHLMRKHIDDKMVAEDSFVERKSIAEFGEFMKEREKFFDELADERKKKQKELALKAEKKLREEIEKELKVAANKE
jgi:hypothetical protein